MQAGVLAVLGQEIGDVNLGGSTDASDTLGPPSHAGGVSVQGNEVIVVDKGKVYTYSMSDIRGQQDGATVHPTAVQTVPGGGSYSAVRDGRLYLGDYKTNKLYVYEKDVSGNWQPVRDASGHAEVHETPDNVQGLVVRDGEFVFSTSPNRFDDGALIVQDRHTGERSDPYELPNMAEGVVEVDGNLVTTYESTAEQYDDDGTKWGWLPGKADDDDLWANPFLTITPLSALGLSEDFEVQPGTLRQASYALDRPSTQLSSAASTVRGVEVSADDLGQVPGAGTFASAVTTLLDATSDSLRSGSKAIALVSDNLMDSATDYARTDEVIGGAFGGLQP